MRRLLLLVVFLSAGCRTVSGPLERPLPGRVDDPRLEIPEQERLGRQILAWPDETVFGNPRSPTPRTVNDNAR